MSTKTKLSLQLDTLKYDNKGIQISEPSADMVAQNLFDKVMEGETTALQVAEMINFTSKVGEILKKKEDITGKHKWNDLVREEIARHSNDGKSTVSAYGTKFSLTEAGTKYDYDVCEDPLWEYYDAEAKRIDKLKKAREKFLQSLSGPNPIGNVMIPETGEIFENVEVYPPSKTSTSTYKTELLKD